MMGLKPHQVLRMRKPAFGDARAPKQWFDSATKEMSRERWYKHKMEPCLFISSRKPVDSDDPREVFYDNQQPFIVDSAFGLHVGDFIGGGERMNSDIDFQETVGDGITCFKDRCLTL